MARRLFTILVACLAVTGWASADEREKIHIRADGEAVTAEFSSVDTTTCELGIETTVHVEGDHGIVIRNRVAQLTDVVAVVVSVYDHCIDAPLLSVTGTGEPGEFVVHPSLKTAYLRAAFEGVDDYNQLVVIAVDLVWNGVNRRERTHYHSNDNYRVFHLVESSHGTIRDAVAGGSVNVDGTDYTPLSSTSATIEKDVTRRLVVYR